MNKRNINQENTGRGRLLIFCRRAFCRNKGKTVQRSKRAIYINRLHHNKDNNIITTKCSANKMLTKIFLEKFRALRAACGGCSPSRTMDDVTSIQFLLLSASSYKEEEDEADITIWEVYKVSWLGEKGTS